MRATRAKAHAHTSTRSAQASTAVLAIVAVTFRISLDVRSYSAPPTSPLAGAMSAAYSSSGDTSALNVRAQVAEEIQRFESVHPFIYRAYDLIARVEDVTLRDQLEKEVVQIEGVF